MIIDKNTVANVAYKIHIDNNNGEMIEFVDESNPKQMVFGINKLIPGFEEGLFGKGNGEFSFYIEPEKAFGEFIDDLKVNVPKEAFMDQGEIREDLLFIGNKINMLDDRGNQMKGTILEVKDKEVLMDFNHPLAGKKLFVEGKIMSIRTATEYDLAPVSGGCGCGSGCGCSSNSANSEVQNSCGCESENESGGCEACGTPMENDGMSHHHHHHHN